MILHIVNGESTLHLLRRSGVEGELFSGDDILMEGPIRNDLATLEDWQFRAAYLDRKLGIPQTDYLAGMLDRQERLRGFPHYKEVVLWFEEDLFCQVNLLYLLHWFAQQDLQATRLSLVCPAEDWLGQLQPAELAALFEQRETVSRSRLETASRAWQAYSREDPASMELILSEDLIDWPLLKRGLKCHLERFPSVSSGLNVVETEILSSLALSSLPFPELFNQVSRSPAAVSHGMGDLQCLGYLVDLSRESQPLVHLEGLRGFPSADLPWQEMSQWVVEITPWGQEVLHGQASLFQGDGCSSNGLDRWLGGVHVTSRQGPWRWDAAGQKLAHA